MEVLSLHQALELAKLTDYHHEYGYFYFKGQPICLSVH
jgi:hypothetical protein